MKYVILAILLFQTSAPLSVSVIANADEIAPGASANYTMEAQGSDPLGRTVSIYFDAPAGMEIWHVGSLGADGCIQPSATRAQCVGTVGAGQGLLMFVSARASSSPRCSDYTAHARVDDHQSQPADAWLTISSSQSICTLAVPLLANGDGMPTVPIDPYPGP